MTVKFPLWLLELLSRAMVVFGLVGVVIGVMGYAKAAQSPPSDRRAWVATPAPGLPTPHRHSVVQRGAAHIVLLNGHLYHVRLDKATVLVSRLESAAGGVPHGHKVEKAAIVMDLVCHQGHVTENLVWQGDWQGEDEDFDGMVREAMKQMRQP